MRIDPLDETVMRTAIGRDWSVTLVMREDPRIRLPYRVVTIDPAGQEDREFVLMGAALMEWFDAVDHNIRRRRALLGHHEPISMLCDDDARSALLGQGQDAA